MSRPGAGLVVLGAVGLAAGFLAFLLFHAGFSHRISPQVLELLPWTRGSLVTPPQNWSSAVCVALWKQPRLAGALFSAVLILMFAAYGTPLWGASRGACPGVSTIIVLFLVFAAPLLATVPVLSADVFAYLSIGEIADRGVNPYSVIIPEQPGIEAKPFSPRARHESIYGPLATRLFQWVHVERATLFERILVIRSCAVVALVLSALLIAAAARKLQRDDHEAKWSVIAFLWNPLVLFECVASAHIDFSIVLLSSAGLYLVARRNVLSGLAVLLMTTALRLTNTFMAPSAAAFAWNHGGRGLRGIGAATRVLLGAAAGFVLWLVPDWLDSNPVEPVLELSRYATDTIPGFVRDSLRPLGIPGRWTLAALRALFVVLVLIGVTRIRSVEAFLRRLSRDWLLLLLFFMSWMHPWYCVGALPAVLLSGSSALVTTLLVFTASQSTVYYFLVFSQFDAPLVRYFLVIVLGIGPAAGFWAASTRRSAKKAVAA